MKRFLALAGSLLAVLLVCATVFFLWASSGRLSEDERAQIKEYPAAAASPERDTFTVMSYNLGYLSGMTNNEPVVRPDSLFANNMDQAVHLIREINPDFIGFQEIDYGGARSAYVHQLDTIATRLGYSSAAQAVNWDERYLPFPYGRPAVHFGRTLSGQAILSRYPIRRHVRKVLPQAPRFFLRDAFFLDYLTQIVVIDIGGWPLAIMNVHLDAFDTNAREKQAEKVASLYNRLSQKGFPILVVGDMNSVLPASKPTLSPELRSMFAEDNTMEILLDETSLRPAFTEGAYVSGQAINTFPASAPNRKIDYILRSPELVIPISQKIRCGGPSPPSDHCAVVMSFLLPRPKDKLPDERIPDEQLPSLESLLAP